jgi:hypothetical protein
MEILEIEDNFFDAVTNCLEALFRNVVNKILVRPTGVSTDVAGLLLLKATPYSLIYATFKKIMEKGVGVEDLGKSPKVSLCRRFLDAGEAIRPLLEAHAFNILKDAKKNVRKDFVTNDFVTLNVMA